MLEQYRCKRFVHLAIDGYDIVIIDAITNEEIYSKTVSEKYIPFIERLFSIIGELAIEPDVIMKYAKINNTRFIIQNDKDPSFIFPKYIRPLIECCYIVAGYWGATLQEIGWGCGQGYQVRFVGVGSWAA